VISIDKAMFDILAPKVGQTGEATFMTLHVLYTPERANSPAGFSDPG
jgi:hypothetical protein